MDRPHGNDLRRGRYSEPGRLYLLTSVTLDRTPHFTDLRSARLLINQFQVAQAERIARSLAWVVMPDHFHWLVELGDRDLKILMSRIKFRRTARSMATSTVAGGYGNTASMTGRCGVKTVCVKWHGIS
ncbi:REP-associated tyrosine transposase [Enterobacterales bacterium AW_CKDN230030176-1A_HGKHYDSX7]